MKRPSRKGSTPPAGLVDRLIAAELFVYLVTYVSPITNEREVVPEIFNSMGEALEETVLMLEEDSEFMPSIIQVCLDPVAYTTKVLGKKKDD